MVETIINAFDIWTEAQGVKSKGRTKSIDNISLEGLARLREFILELAIRGKLVPQNPKDEPASVLLMKIRKEKEKLVKEGKIRKEKPLPEIKEDEKPFRLPQGWEWVRLGDVAILISGQHIEAADWNSNADGFPYLTGPSDFGSYHPIITRWTKKPKVFALEGDILITVKGSGVGKLNILDQDNVAIGRQLMAIRLLGSEKGFALVFLESNFHVFQNEKMGIAIPGISREDILEKIFPLPPFSEQHRIVAKVNELMALCDKLEQEKTASLKTHQTLVSALLQTLTTAPDAGELESAWQRLASHFDILFCTEDSVEQLKQTILQLAVMGRLVKQDPNDEPAYKAIESLKIEKENLIKEGKFDPERKIISVKEKNTPFKLPKSWVWCRYMDVAELKHGHQFREHDFVPSGIPVIKITQCKSNGSLDLTKCDFINKTRFEEFKHFLIFKDDLLMALTGGTLGKVTRVDKDYGAIVQNYRVGKFIPNDSVLSKSFLTIILQSNLFQSLVRGKINQSAQPNVGKDDIEKLIIPLPPLAEQHRIVAKVNELMALCDRLKERLSKAQEIQNTLSQTLIETAVA